jgi:hypothetical protein
MAVLPDLKEVFPVLADPTTGAGSSPNPVQVGTLPAALVGLLSLAFKDAAGNLVLPALNTDGRLPVDTGSTGTPSAVRGENTAVPNSTLTLVTGATKTLTASKSVRQVTGMVSCRTDCYFAIVTNDGTTDTIVGDVVLGPGQYSFAFNLQNFRFATPGTGAYTIAVKAQSLGLGTAAARASLTFIEV